ncbi:MAG: FkbM family methyltransferase [Chthoniobacterales bacterium]|nr:FkbM family methyltransferase [Chthoniobacterales bacterium]
MNARLYKLGMIGLQWLTSFEPVAAPLETFSRVVQRHRKLYSHLRAQKFDGVIDGGANVGEFAQIVRSALPMADLVCVEPNRECAAALRSRGFRVVEAALWHEATQLMLTQPTDASTSCTVMAEGDQSVPAWTVEAVRLDSLQISGSRILVKLDLQGAEFQALDGMGGLWERCAGLLLEVSLGDGGTYERMRELLAARGYHESSTTNELWQDGRVIEADKLWLRAA